MVAALLALTAMGTFYLQPGDRVALFGDSITEFGNYSNFLEAAVRTRYPSLDVTFTNVGWAGDTTWGSTGWEGAPGGPVERASRDIAPLKPTVITSMLGMNDAGYVPYTADIDKTFTEWYGKLLDEFKTVAPDARVTLLSTSPWDDFARPPAFFEGIEGVGGYNAVLAKYAKTVETTAKERGYGYIDINLPVAETVTRAALLDKELAPKLIPDRIHPSPALGMVIAAEILKAWEFQPQVTMVEMNAKFNGNAQNFNSDVGPMKDLSWTQTDRALPLPIDPADKESHLITDPSVGQSLSALNQQPLRVAGLEPGAYRLFIDDQPVVTADAKRFEEGINLALMKTPMREQSLEVLELVKKKNRLVFLGWREIGIAFGSRKSTGDAVEALGKLVEEMEWEIQAASQPRPHLFRLVKV